MGKERIFSSSMLIDYLLPRESILKGWEIRRRIFTAAKPNKARFPDYLQHSGCHSRLNVEYIPAPPRLEMG